MLFHRPFSQCIAMWVTLILLLMISQGVYARGMNDEAEFVSHEGTALFLLAGSLQPLLTDSEAGKTESLRTVDALAASMLVTQSLKMTIHETRPDGSSDDSFPSGHATAAFSIATAVSHFHPDQAPYWYLGAVLIAGSRVQLDRHYPQDVLAGAAIGYLTTRWALEHQNGVLLTPIIDSDTNSRGILLTTAF